MSKNLSDFVKTTGLKKEMEKRGCILPENFESQLEVHLLALAHRLTPERPEPLHFESLKVVPNVMRSFFAKPRFGWGEWIVSYDETFIRGWKREVLVPKDVEDVVPEDLFEVMKIVQYGLEVFSFTIKSAKPLIARIPRERARRDGAYRFLTIGATGAVGYSPARQRDSVSIMAMQGRDFLHVFRGPIEAVANLNKPRYFHNSILKDDQFFLFTR